MKLVSYQVASPSSLRTGGNIAEGSQQMGLRVGQDPKTLNAYDSYEAKGPIPGDLLWEGSGFLYW